MNRTSGGSDNRSVSVLIVGGGPIGLSMGVALDRFSIASLVVEKSAGTTAHPKSRGTFVRTMEIFRQWGVSDHLKARGLPDNTDVLALRDSIVGHEYGRTLPEPNRQESPVWKCVVAQDAVEEELARVLGECTHSTLRFSTEMTDFDDFGDRVQVELVDLDTGKKETWFADYLIAADGAASGIRRGAAIEMVGPPTLAVMLNEYWRADLSAYPIAKEAAFIRVYPTDDNLPIASTLNTNGVDRWLTLIRVGSEADERKRPWNDAETIEFIRTHVGLPDLDISLINRSIWRVSKQVAETFRRGRVLLVGDAGHRFPPTGGWGMNTGVQDAHNLAWKIAFVLSGVASEELLDSYDTERRPIAHSNADFSFINAQRFSDVDAAARSGDADRIAFWLREFENHTHNVGRGLGFHYEAGAVILDGSVPPVADSRRYTATDRPGGRFPHFWLDEQCTRSTLDWFDRSMVLVVGPEGQAWLDAATRVASALSISLKVHRLEHLYEDRGIEMGRRGAALVRPDGHVAWRMAWLPPDSERQLATALQQLLGLTTNQHQQSRRHYVHF